MRDRWWRGGCEGVRDSKVELRLGKGCEGVGVARWS